MFPSQTNPIRNSLHKILKKKNYKKNIKLHSEETPP